MTEVARVAVLIDADNVSPLLAAAIVAETAKHGTLGVKRIYGDWTTGQLAGWKRVLPRYAIQPQQQFAYTTGKNATDSALIIDAMDLLYAGSVDTFCIIANDSDYTGLAVRLRESGKRVFGLGRKDASVSFQNACDRFTYLEVLATQGALPAEPSDLGPALVTGAGSASGYAPRLTAPGAIQRAGVESVDEAAKVVLPAIAASANEDGWSLLANVGWSIVNNTPTFDSRNYGFDKLSALVRELSAVETKVQPDANGVGQLWARLRGRD